MEPAEPLHRLEGRRPHRGGHGRGASRRRHAERRTAAASTAPSPRTLKRAHNTLDIILDELGQRKLPTVKAAALNERDYGELVGINKEDARKRWGPEQVHIWQRSYDIAPPGGELLKDTAARVVPFFEKWIVPELQEGKSVIVVAHGNSLRSLIMELDRLSPDEVMQVELATGMPLIYRLNADGTVAEKRDLAA